MFERAAESARRGATHTVTVPAGPLGLTFEEKAKTNKGVVVESIAPDSPLNDLMNRGWLLLAVNGVRVAPMDINGAIKLLQRREGQPRTLTLLDWRSEQKLLSSVYETWSSMQKEVVVEAPAGKLGISFGVEARGGTRVVVSKVAPKSPLVGQVGVGWHLLSVDDTNVSALSTSDEVADVLRQKSEQSVRRLAFDPEKHIRVPLVFGALLALLLAISIGAVVYPSSRRMMGAGPRDEF